MDFVWLFPENRFLNVSGTRQFIQKISFERVVCQLLNHLLSIALFIPFAGATPSFVHANSASLILTATNVSCHSGNDGTIVSVLTGGTGGTVNYTLTPGSATNTNGSFTGLTVGTWTVNANDSGNVTSASVSITEPAASLSAIITAQTNVFCKGNATGALTVAGSGGTVGYTYSTNGGATYQASGTFTARSAGTSIVTVKDAAGCIVNQNFTISEPTTSLTALVTAQTNVLCKGNATGAVTVAGSGGTAGYTYSINGGATYQASGTFTALSAGAFTIRVKDAAGCLFDQSVNVGEPTAALGVIAASNSPVCTNTLLNLNATGIGGTSPYTYTWSGPNSFSSSSQAPVILNPATTASGSYIVNIKDANNCTSNNSVVTTVIAAPVVNASSSISATCEGGPVTLSSNSNIPPPTTVALLSENFNLTAPGWTTVNNSTGGTPSSAAWTKQNDGHALGGTTFHSNDLSPFYLSDSRSQNGTKTETYLKSPAINTVGYSSLTLNFWHYFRFENVNNEAAKVQVSTNGTSWSDVDSFTSGQGSSNSFKNASYDLSAYINQATLYIRFYYYSDQRARYWAIDNFNLSGVAATTTPVISWSSSPAGFTSSVANPPVTYPNVTTTYMVSYFNPSTNCSSFATVTVTVYPKPNVTIQPNYCAVPGHIRLTAGGGTTYLWSTGETINPILVDIASNYTVSSTNAFGCTGSATLPVSTELVTNGDFSAGNTGFTSAYGSTTAPNGLFPEGLYAVGSDPTFYHSNFWGRDHTSNTGNFLLVNGSGSNPPVVAWQETVTVLPNTEYYFAAWAASLNNVSPYANLQFSVNGVLVGTTAPLSARASNNNPPYNWQRFYGNWNSGANTTAIIQIVDLQTALGGNDFGLDDISFGTLAPIPFTITPIVNPSATICSGNTIYLKAGLAGGRNPITYSWSGPNGFTSTTKDPAIPFAVLANSGVYTLSVVDGYGCDPVIGTTAATVVPTPTPAISTVGSGTNCPGSQVRYWNNPQPNVTNSWSVTGGNIVGSSVKDSVDIKWSLSGSGLINLTATNSLTLCDSTVTRTVLFQDLIPPVLIPPSPFSFCVEDLISASIVSNLLKINPNPDYYQFRHGNTALDADPTTFSDNCTPANQLILHWRIDFTGPGSPASISGTGQPSAYPTDIFFPGDGTTYLNVVHTITYWVVDLSGNESIHHTIAITIKPRPVVSFNNLNPKSIASNKKTQTFGNNIPDRKARLNNQIFFSLKFLFYETIDSFVVGNRDGCHFCAWSDCCYRICTSTDYLHG